MIEIQRVTPARRSSLLLGRVLRDVVVLVVQGTVLTVVAIPFGLRAPVLGAVLGVVVVALLGAALSATSYAVALTLKSEDALAPLLNGLAIPVLLLSGILLPMTLGPTWLQKLSDFMPFRWIVDAVRDTFGGDIATAQVAYGLIAAVILAALGTWWGTSVFRKENA